MALLPCVKLLFATSKCYITRHVPVRTLMSKQLVYCEFGDPLNVVKIREAAVKKLADQEVLVRMLAAPVNPADINTIQGLYPCLPQLPHVPGDEGVGDVVEVGPLVTYVKPDQRVVFSKRQLGTWRYYGVYNEYCVHKIPPNIPLAEACMLSVAPVTAYRMLHDFRTKELCPGQSVIQTGANSPVGQSVIQICKAMGVSTLNIVANHCGYEHVKEHLLSLGANYVYTLEEAEQLACCCLSFQRPALAINCLGGRCEDVLLMLLERNGSMVYYGGAYDLCTLKQWVRPDVQFHRFHLHTWNNNSSHVLRDQTYTRLQELIVMGKLRAPKYQPLMLHNYVYAFRNTCPYEAFSALNYVFDFSLI